MKKNTKQDPPDDRHERNSLEPSGGCDLCQAVTDENNQEEIKEAQVSAREEERYIDIILSKDTRRIGLFTNYRKHRTLKYSSGTRVSGTNVVSSANYVRSDKNKMSKGNVSSSPRLSEDREITWMRWLDVNFTKYITIFYPPGVSVPFLLLNRQDNKEWFEAQWAYEKHVSEEAIRCRKNTISKERQYECCKCQMDHHSLSGSCSVSEHTVLCKDPRFQLNLPQGIVSRFNKEKCALFMKANVELSTNSISILCSDVHETVHISLHWIIKQLCMSAMRSYLFPVEAVHFLWIGNIQRKALDLMKDDNTRLIFPTWPCLNRYHAILILGGNASHLMRHQQTCFIHSIASVLSIQLNEILVLSSIKPESHLEAFVRVS